MYILYIANSLGKKNIPRNIRYNILNNFIEFFSYFDTLETQ